MPSSAQYHQHQQQQQQQQQQWGIWNNNSFSSGFQKPMSKSETGLNRQLSNSWSDDLNTQDQSSQDFSPRKRVVERIQEDFPRTPSPFFSLLRDDELAFQQGFNFIFIFIFIFIFFIIKSQINDLNFLFFIIIFIYFIYFPPFFLILI